MPSGVYKRKPQPKSVRVKISRTLKARKTANRTGKPVYPWGRWFAKRRTGFSVAQQLDFTCSVPSFVQAVRNEASDRGISIKITVSGKEVEVRITKRK